MPSGSRNPNQSSAEGVLTNRPIRAPLSGVRALCLAALSVVAHAVAAATAQDAPQQAIGSRTDALRIFLDCRSCDENYLRTEVTFVNYVRDRIGADVHVLVTTQATGGGGTEYTLKFIGLGRFTGVDQTLTYLAPQTATSDERRRGYTSVFKLGLVRYAAETPLGSRLTIRFEEPKDQTSAASVRDPWNFWVFRLGGGGDFDGEESQQDRGAEVSFSANRTTERWKININGSAEYNSERFKLEEGDTFTALRRDTEARTLVVKSLNERWSTGGVAALASSTFQNYDLRTRFGPGLEYNFFRYAESTRRLLTVFYSVGLQSANYTEETIFGRTSERLVDHQVEVSLALRQPWGSASASVEGLHYLNRKSKYRIDASGEIDVRLFKGFTFDISAGASRRRDQLSLRRGSATTEEILVRQRELATGYQYELGFGFSYSFGSVFNNVVNPRFRNVGGF